MVKMLGINPLTDFHLSDEIKDNYPLLVRAGEKAYQEFQEKLVSLALAHRNVLEENIKLHAINKALNDEVYRLSHECDNNNISHGQLFPEAQLKNKNSSKEDSFSENGTQFEDEVIGPSPGKTLSNIKSKLRLPLGNNGVAKKLRCDKSLEKDLQKCSSTPLKNSQEIPKDHFDIAHQNKLEAEDSFDETYFPGYHAEDHESYKHRKNLQHFPDPKDEPIVQTHTTKYAISTYDRLPATAHKEPSFVYEEKAVRKKAEKAKLKGHVCEECHPWWDNCGLEEKEKAKLIQKSSKHRGHFPPVQKQAPESFWDPLIETILSDDDKS